MKKVIKYAAGKFITVLIMLVLVGCSKSNARFLNPNDQAAETIKDNSTQSPEESDTESNSTQSDNVQSPSEYNTLSTDEYLCKENENVLLRFYMANLQKIVTICLSENKKDYIIYRYGSKDNIELEFPKSIDRSWDEFTYSYYIRGGGAENEALDLNYLEFENDGYQYKIYEMYSQEGILVGIQVTDKSTGQETNIEGDSDSLYGSLRDLRDNENINIIIQ